MSEPTPDVDEAVCWQCGAPPDPACANTMTLYAKSRERKDGQGYPVVRSRLWWHAYDSVHVSIPWCEACHDRQQRVQFLLAAGIVVGLVVGSALGGWMILVGFLSAAATVILGSILYERHSGRRTGWTPTRHSGAFTRRAGEVPRNDGGLGGGWMACGGCGRG